MELLLEEIRRAVAEGRVVATMHGNERLRERGVMFWQVIAGLEAGHLIAERAADVPLPSIEVQQRLADGTDVHGVWSYSRSLRLARLVTVHFYNW
jgi:hypothetical protein